MAINWNDPGKNSAADLADYRKFIADTDPAVDHSDLYRPTATGNGTAGSNPQKGASASTQSAR